MTAPTLRSGSWLLWRTSSHSCRRRRSCLEVAIAISVRYLFGRRGLPRGTKEMTLLAGSSLDQKRFFKSGNPQVQGSSFDLTIGCIFDHQGKRVDGPFTIRPGHMVQVVSSEELKLSDRLTGHVTYKTTMTKNGIWALTVGIVDPGWEGPIATTLLNFSRIDQSVAEGDAFLRVSFFEHEAVSPDKLRKAPSLENYLKDIQKIAASRFPTTFLNTTEITEAAGKAVLSEIRSNALAWVVGIALLFTVAQITIQLVAPWLPSAGRPTSSEVEALRDRVTSLQEKLLKLEAGASSLAAQPAAAPLPAPTPSPAVTVVPAPGSSPAGTPPLTPASPISATPLPAPAAPAIKHSESDKGPPTR
ncbi:dCTP deaminase domain-containing protein [Bradyrhizobium quebecense]